MERCVLDLLKFLIDVTVLLLFVTVLGSIYGAKTLTTFGVFYAVCPQYAPGQIYETILYFISHFFEVYYNLIL